MFRTRIFKIKVRGEGHSDQKKMVHETSPSKHGIWNTCLKEYRRYAPDLMPVLETRLEAKVTFTKGLYATLHHPKMHLHNKFGESYLKLYKRYAPDTFILKSRSEDNVTVSQKRYMTLFHPKMHPHNKFGIPTSNNVRDMLVILYF